LPTLPQQPQQPRMFPAPPTNYRAGELLLAAALPSFRLVPCNRDSPHGRLLTATFSSPSISIIKCQVCWLVHIGDAVPAAAAAAAWPQGLGDDCVSTGGRTSNANA
jgi:hypothetical protein